MNRRDVDGRTRFSQGDYIVPERRRWRFQSIILIVTATDGGPRLSARRCCPWSLHSDPPLRLFVKKPSQPASLGTVQGSGITRARIIARNSRYPSSSAIKRETTRLRRDAAGVRTHEDAVVLRIGANSPFSWTLIEVNYDLTGSPSTEKHKRYFTID